MTSVPPRRVAAAARASQLAGAIVAIGGAAVLLGWAFEIAALKAPLLHHGEMKANTALAFMLIGAALAVTPKTTTVDWLARTLAALAVAIGAVTLLEWMCAWTAGIDQLLVVDPHGVTRGRMASTTAAALTALGIAVAIPRGRGAKMVTALSVIPLVVGVLSLVDYGYGIRSLYGVVSHSATPVHTGAVLMAASVGVLLRRPDISWVGLVLSDGIGGATARRLLPFAIAAPIGLGWLLLQGPRLGLYGTGLSLALVVVSRIAVLTVVILGTARSLERMDAELTERKRREWRLQEASRMKGEFLANMSHELRTPLNAIIGFTRVVHQGKAGALSPEQHEYLGEVLTSSTHLLKLVNELLQHSDADPVNDQVVAGFISSDSVLCPEGGAKRSQ